MSSLSIIVNNFTQSQMRSKPSIEVAKSWQQTHQIKMSVPVMPELFIKLPKPQPTRKTISSSTQETNLSQLQQGQLTLEEDTPRFLDNPFSIYNSPSCNQLSSNQGTKSSTDTVKQVKSEKEIIFEWVKNIFEKRQLLGCHWEDIFKQKHKDLVITAFLKIKQQNQLITAELFMESRHWPKIRKQNHLIYMAIQESSILVNRILTKIKRNGFLQIIRFSSMKKVEAQMPNLNQLHKNTDNSKNKKQANIEKTLKKQTINQDKNINSQKLLSQLQQQDTRLRVGPQYNPVSLKLIQSAKALPIVDNQYAMASVALTSKRNTKPVNKQLNHPMQYQSPVNNKMQKQQVNKKNSLQKGSKMVGNNVKYQYNQHNYFVVASNHPNNIHILNQGCKQQQTNRQISNNQDYYLPPNIFATGKNNQLKNQKNNNFIANPLQQPSTNRNNYLISETITRPHSHQPKTLNQNIKNQFIAQSPFPNQIQPQNRVRATSSSPNIKISFMGKQVRQIQMVNNKPKGDYIEQQYYIGQQINKPNIQNMPLNRQNIMKQSLPMIPGQIRYEQPSSYYKGQSKSPCLNTVTSTQGYGKQSFLPVGNRNDIMNHAGLRHSLQIPQNNHDFIIGKQSGEFNVGNNLPRFLPN